MFSNITEINPILELFMSKNPPSSLFVILFFIDLVFFVVMAGLSLLISDFTRINKYTPFVRKIISWQKWLYIVTFIAICLVFVFHYETTNKAIRKTPLKSVFSSYRIAKIKQPKESDSAITYDAFGNQKSERPKTLFKVYLDKTKDVKNIELEHDVILEVSKVNKDSFDIILPDEKVETIKKDDAPEVFNALNKIKSDEHYGEVMKMIRTREVTEEK